MVTIQGIETDSANLYSSSFVHIHKLSHTLYFCSTQEYERSVGGGRPVILKHLRNFWLVSTFVFCYFYLVWYFKVVMADEYTQYQAQCKHLLNI